MCPLRLILIFLSATLAGFFLVRNLKSRPPVDTEVESTNADDHNSSSRFSKVRAAIQSGFWTCADMASGRYLWRHLVSSKNPST
ncbi:hypothetical protein SLE2022_198880 [Rubroshorea leprosula]